MKKLLSLILASLILSMSAAMVSADEAAAPAAEATAPTTEAAPAETEAPAETTAETTEAAPEAAAETTDAAEAEIMLISEETEAEPAAEAETEEVVVKVLTEGEEGYITGTVEGQTLVNVLSITDDTNGAIDPRLLIDHNGVTGITYTHSPDALPILNLTFELDEPTVIKSLAFSCSVDTAGAVDAVLYGTNDPELKEWTCLESEPAEAGENFYNYSTVVKYVREFKYYLVSLAFAPIDTETDEVDMTAPATFLLTEVELFKEAPEEPVEPANNLPSFPIYNNPNSFTNHIG